MKTYTRAILIPALVLTLQSPAFAESEDNPCDGDGPNPCCIWQESGNCTIADSLSDCNIYYHPSDGDISLGEGAYAPGCGDYLEDNMTNSEVVWMSTAIEELQSYVTSKGILVTDGMDDADFESAADGLVENPWTSFDTSNGKCMGAGFDSGTYIGIYNCDSHFEEEGHHTACDLFRYSSKYNADKYAAGMRYLPTTGTTCSKTIQKDDETEPCAFNLFPDIDSLVSEENDFQWAFNTTHPFLATERGWWSAADEGEGSVVFLDPYPNYDTDHPVFGYAAGVFDDGTMESAVIVLQYVADNPCYLEYCSSSQSEP